MNKIRKNEKGITLITLIVTIVVLIILATISINAIFGEGGLISRAEQAKEEQRAGEVKDQVSLWKADKTLAAHTGESAKTLAEFLTELEGAGLLTAEEKAKVEEEGKVKIGSQTIEFGSEARTLVELFDAGELKIGDYINFPNPTSGERTILGTQTGMQNKKDKGNTVADEDLNQVYNVANNQLNWRVLGKDKETGGLKLIAGSPMKKETTSGNPYLNLYGAKGYIEGITVLDNIASLYENQYTTKARSITVEDINEAVGVTVDESGRPSLDESGRYGQTYSYTDQYASPEDYLAGTKSNFSKTGDFYYYLADNPALKTATDSRLFDMLFGNVEYGTGKAYWLASRCVRADSTGAGFSMRGVFSGDDDAGVYARILFSSSGIGIAYGLAVRPVVILKSDVTEEDMQKIEDKTEETWGDSGSSGGK